MFSNVSFSYSKTPWSINNLQLEKLNLFVGLSGVGKTRTMQSIMNLKKIAKGEYINGFEWTVKFEIGKDTYSWSGKFNQVNEEDIEVVGSKMGINIRLKKPRLVSEILTCNDKKIIDVDEERTLFNGAKLPKLNQRSLLSIFQGENVIDVIGNYFQNVFEFNYDQEYKFAMKERVMTAVANEIKNVTKLRNTDLPIINKLCILYRIDKKLFEEISDKFRQIFPFIKRIKFDIYRDDNVILYIQESNNAWVPQHEISSGMFKTLLLISELMLLAPNSVALIDEFENGLGINCINKIAEIIMESECSQYIISSHHPYIINNFPTTTWKIFGRENGKMVIKKADEAKIGISSHESFKQLINSNDYIGGIN